ncbi:MAG TPA: SDR family oxidoreductase [Trebonia sp.]|nr:SDR family oxidoreductase [Trebonia sp.]
MTSGFEGRRAAITGGAGSIGAAIGAMLLERGASQVYALDLKHSAEVPERAVFLAADITSEDSVAAAVREIYARGDGPVDLVNCAGIVEDDVAAEDMPMSTYDAVMAVNLRGYFLSCREFGRELLRRGGGAIVNVASMSGNAIVNYPQKQSVYNASKAGVSALTRSLAVEWGPRGVRVNAVSPGYVDTPLNALKKHLHAQWTAETPLGRFGDVREIAAAACYLLSDEAGFCLGTELLIDGGFSLR